MNCFFLPAASLFSRKRRSGPGSLLQSPPEGVVPRTIVPRAAAVRTWAPNVVPVLIVPGADTSVVVSVSTDVQAESAKFPKLRSVRAAARGPRLLSRNTCSVASFLPSRFSTYSLTFHFSCSASKYIANDMSIRWWEVEECVKQGDAVFRRRIRQCRREVSCGLGVGRSSCGRDVGHVVRVTSSSWAWSGG